MKWHRALVRVSLLAPLVALASCGGGGGSMASTSPPGGGGTCSGAPFTTSCQAATQTVANDAMCSAANISTPFYWEIGDANGPIVSGQSLGTSVTSTTPLLIASASKWIYAAYVVQVRGGPANLDPVNDVPFLNFTSGYTYLGNYPPSNPACLSKTATVNDCLAGLPSSPDPSTQGLFDYDSDHMEWHAGTVMSLGADGLQLLATDIQTGLAGATANFPNLNFQYWNVLLSGGVTTTADDYAAFLREILSHNLLIYSALGADAVCTWPASASVPSNVKQCQTYSVANSSATPIYTASTNAGHPEYWHYSLGHWIEDDPNVGDGAFSSPGALGFYPWIDSSVHYYGLIARQDNNARTSGVFAGYTSAECGRLVRKAWMTGVAQ